MPGNIAKELFNFVNSPKHSKLLTFEECELLCTIKKKTFKYNCTNDMALISYFHLPRPFQCTDGTRECPKLDIGRKGSGYSSSVMCRLLSLAFSVT